MEGNLRFKTDWASLIVGSEFTVFALFYFVFEGNFPSTSPPRGGGVLYLDGLFNGGFFLRYRFGELVFGGACTWRGLFSEFYGKLHNDGFNTYRDMMYSTKHETTALEIQTRDIRFPPHQERASHFLS